MGFLNKFKTRIVRSRSGFQNGQQSLHPLILIFSIITPTSRDYTSESACTNTDFLQNHFRKEDRGSSIDLQLITAAAAASLKISCTSDFLNPFSQMVCSDDDTHLSLPAPFGLTKSDSCDFGSPCQCDERSVRELERPATRGRCQNKRTFDLFVHLLTQYYLP